MGFERDKINLSDENTHKKMCGWFDITVLLDAAKRSIISAVFGAYADRRLIRAAIENIDEGDKGNRVIKLTDKYDLENQEEVWVDYVADLGDGFDSTYTIAYLLGQKKLTVSTKGGEIDLPRGDVLLMGGDEVYPTPTRDDYSNRLERPYKYASPDKNKNDRKRPLLFMIPGNHDWYDGLTLFLAKYCQGLGSSFAKSNWRMFQRRSYFATQLNEKWSVWGMDTQLDDDVDAPQAKYFESIAKDLNDGSNVILCASVPTWIKSDYPEEKYRTAFGKTVDYFATNIIKKYGKNINIHVVLSGDLHHYSRYVSEYRNTQFITSGGGGAFLHPTHQLTDEIKNINFQGKPTPLKLAKGKNSSDGAEIEAVFPEREISRALAKGTLKFPLINKQFIAALGTLYAGLVWLMSFGVSSFFSQHPIDEMLSAPTAFLSLVLLFLALRQYADHDTTSYFPEIKNPLCKKIVAWLACKKSIAGAVHALAHMFAIIATVCLSVYAFNCILSNGVYWRNSYSFVWFLILVGAIGGFLGGFVWGLYLFISSHFFDRHYNDAFSSMRLDSYKNFLRMHIQGDKLTIYPIGVKDVPMRKDWKVNRGDVDTDSWVISTKGIEYELIENPVVIEHQ